MIRIGLAAIAADFDGHMDWDGGWGIAMVIGMVIFWVVVIAAVIWLVREVTVSRRPGSGGSPAPLEILDRRLAEGEISIEEYERSRSAIQRNAKPV